MNGIAQLAAHAGFRVTGSDRSPEHLEYLERLGIRILPQDGSGITAETSAAVYSTAIENDNPDLVRARERGVPQIHRAAMLASLCRDKPLIAVAGTAGKSTVTGLLGWIFECLGQDPSVYCGAPVLNWQRDGMPGNVRYGSGPWIIEADESDRSFLSFHPQHAIITNIAEDHFDLDELHRLFNQFRSQVGDLVIEGSVLPDDDSEPPFCPALPGRHNRENIQSALALCQGLGLDPTRCANAVKSFLGIERRLQRIGANVIDDFAHSPVKIAAALETVSGLWPRFCACWRPHGYAPLRKGQEGFLEVFEQHWTKRPQDRLFLLPVYYAGGTTDQTITAEHFAGQLQQRGIPAEYADGFDVLESRLLEIGLPVLILGARDPGLPLFARRMAQHSVEESAD